MHLIALTSLSKSFCAAAAGEPLRGHTVTTEQGRPVAYLIGAVSHRAATRGVVVDLPLTPNQVTQALLRSLQVAFPGPLECTDHEEVAELLRLAADLPVGGIVRISPQSWSGYQPTTESLAAAQALAPVTAALLQQLLE